MSEWIGNRRFSIVLQIKDVKRINDSKDSVVTEAFVSKRLKQSQIFELSPNKESRLIFNDTLIPNHYVSMDFYLKQVASPSNSLDSMFGVCAEEEGDYEPNKEIFSWKVADE